MSDLEQRLLAKLTETKELARVYELGLRAEVFFDDLHRFVFDWMIDYWLASNMVAAPTWVVLEIEFPNLRLDHNITESVEWLVDNLKRRWITKVLQDIMREAINTAADDPEATLARLWHESYDASETVAPRFSRANMAETVQTRRERYAHRHDEQAGGLTLGLAALDVHTRGILPGELCAVAAYTKVGKTFFMYNAAVTARRAGWTPLVMTLEQSIEETEDRIDALFSGVSYQRLQAAALTIDESSTLLGAREELAGMGPIYVERPKRGERTIKNMVTRARQLGADYLIVDQLSFIDGEREYRGDKMLTQKHGDLIFDLKDAISQESAGALPCLLAVQLNRETMRTTAQQAQGGRGGLWNFANSSMIEQTVDLAIGLWRSREARANNAMMLDIMGSRRCDLKSWILSWHLQERTEITVREEYRD